MKIKLTPEKETLKTNIVERTIGRAVSVDPATPPFGPASQDLLGDVFHALYNADLEPLKDEDAPYDRRINHALMKWMAKDQEFMTARERTTGKLAHSMVSSKLLYEYLITDDAIRQALLVQEEEEKKQQEGSGGNGEGGGQGNAMDSALARLNGLSKNVIGSQIMSLGAKKANEQAEKVDKAMKSWGVEAGDVTVNNIDDIMNLVDNNSSKMQEISDLAGRFESVAASALEKVRESYIGQIVDTKRTREFETMYGTELFYLLSPDVPPLIHAKYAADYVEAGLLGVETRSEGKEFGSLKIMVDGSGSMEGELEVYSKAVAIGLAKAMNRDSLNKREYSLTTFGSHHDAFYSVTSKEDWSKHFEWASIMQGGGTDFDSAFNKAIHDIREMPEGTDLAFITDGECSLSSYMVGEWKQFKSETGTRLLYVDVSGRENNQLKELADLYIKVEIRDGKMEMIAEDIASKLAENMETSRLNKNSAEGD